MFLILFVLHDTSKLEGIMRAWTETGVRGVTILLSTGYRKFTEGNILREDLPLIFSIEDILNTRNAPTAPFFQWSKMKKQLTG